MGRKTNNEPAYIMQIHANKYFKKLDQAKINTKAENNTQEKEPVVNAEELIGYHKDKKSKEYKRDSTLYIGIMPDSLELRYLKTKFKNEFQIKKKASGKEIIKTDCIIDVLFDNSYKTKHEKLVEYVYSKKTDDYSTARPKSVVQKEKAEIRTDMYINGFDLLVDGVKRHYVFYQRGANKAKSAHCMFIDEKLIEDINRWAFMDLDFSNDDQCDMTSLLSYRALTTSGLDGDVTIFPKEILLISDLAPAYQTLASVTRYDKAKNCINVSNEEIELHQELFDGQSLLDVSKFTGYYATKGCVLLRNKFFKSCAFNTNIQKWFEDHQISIVEDMFGQEHKASDIKLIATPNSLKALKFSYKLVNKKPKDNDYLPIEQKYLMYKYWLKNMLYTFGIVKYEKPSHIKCDDNSVKNQMSYQMVNSLPLSRQEVEELCQYNINNIEAIQNDFDAFKKYLNDTKSDCGSSISLAMLCNVNQDIQYTKLYKDHRKEVVKTLKERLLHGRIIVDGDNCTMVSNPIEMLRHAIGQVISDDIQELKPYEIFTPLFEDNVELTGFRSPHIASGNVCVFTNRHNETIAKYMNLTKNIVVMNSYKNDVMARLQGADTDSDFLLLVNNEIILKAAKLCRDFPTPINMIKGKPADEPYSIERLALIDNDLSSDLIGNICNLAQIFNSYYWDYKYKGADKDTLNGIYNSISILSSLSQIAIDRAKKNFDCDINKELGVLRASPVIQRLPKEKRRNNLSAKRKANREEIDTKYNTGKISDEERKGQAKALEYQIIKTQVRPLFFKYNSDFKDCKFEKFETPMDYVVECVKKISKANRQDKEVELHDLLIEKPTDRSESRMAAEIVEKAKDVRKIQKKSFADQEADIIDKGYEAWKAYKKTTFDEAVAEIKKRKLSQATMYQLICWAYGKSTGHLKRKEEIQDCKKTLLDLLVEAFPDIFYSCFRAKNA